MKQELSILCTGRRAQVLNLLCLQPIFAKTVLLVSKRSEVYFVS